MIHINPFLYQYLCTTSSSLITLPLDIAQTKILSPSPTIIDFNEIKWLLLFPLIFTSQNVIYNELHYIQNTLLRGAMAGILTTPIYTYLETRKLYTRINLVPNYNIYIKFILLRQTLFYSILYQIAKINNSNFMAAFIANMIGFPIKLLALSKSYSVFVINSKSIKLTAILEIIKSSISDGAALFLMYSPSFSPLKK
tara:strand:- start:11835 stop:12425 length:591 start_codon:yes stop_codon:yes gene_type:complete